MFKFNFYHTRKENFFHNNNPEQTKGLIGNLRGDFGKDGTEFWHTWNDKNEKLNTPEFKKDFDSVMETLRERLLTDRAYMRSFAYNHPDTKIADENTTSHGMFVETENYEYAIRTISDNGNYDFYIYCYDKRVQEPQFLNSRRFRDENGQLIEKVPEIARKTIAEARNYYIDGDRYENKGKEYTFRRTEDNTYFEATDGEKIFVIPEAMGTYLPDVASEGLAFSKVPLKHTLSELTLGDLIKSVKLSSVHIVHDEMDIELATIEDLDDNMFTQEGKAAWSDVLGARVKQLFDGVYGVQIEVSGVDHERVSAFSYMLAGYCSDSDYNKWIKPEEEQNQNMNM